MRTGVTFQGEKMSNQRKRLVYLLLLYFSGSAVFMYFSLWYFDNPDTFQYLSIAQKYASGNFNLAINGYWSPLFSWLLVLPLKSGVGGLVSIKILQCFLGAIALTGFEKLCYRTGLNESFIWILLLCLLPFGISYAQLNATPDLLFVCVLIYLFLNLSQGSWQNGNKYAIISGILGALLFFTKSFGFPYFLALFVVAVWIRHKKYHASFSWRPHFISLGIFFVLCSFWIVPLSLKYDTLTISKVPAFNLSKEVASTPGQIVELPILTEGLIPPPDSLSYSAWENPGEAVTLTALHPLSVNSDRSFYKQVLKRNILSIYYSDFKRKAGFVFVLIFIMFNVLFGWRELWRNSMVKFLLISALILYGGYSLVLVHTRYVWMCTWIMLLISAWMLQRIQENRKMKQIVPLVLVLLSLVAVKEPLKELFFTQKTNIPYFWYWKVATHPVETLQVMYHEDKARRLFVRKLQNEEFMHSRIASLRPNTPSRSDYCSSLFVSSFLDMHFFGRLSNTKSYEEQMQQLRSNQIDYLFVWNREVWSQGEAGGMIPVLDDEEAGVKVYRVKEL